MRPRRQSGNRCTPSCRRPATRASFRRRRKAAKSIPARPGLLERRYRRRWCRSTRRSSRRRTGSSRRQVRPSPPPTGRERRPGRQRHRYPVDHERRPARARRECRPCPGPRPCRASRPHPGDLAVRRRPASPRCSSRARMTTQWRTTSPRGDRKPGRCPTEASPRSPSASSSSPSASCLRASPPAAVRCRSGPRR